MATTILHGHPRSSATARVRIALHLKGVPYEFRVVDLFARENLGEAYRGINPLGQVPTLEIDGDRLTQSVAICEYLDETRPEPALLPADPLARAHCRRLVEIVNAGIQPLQNKGVLDKLISEYDDTRLSDMFKGIHPKGDVGDSWPQHFIRKGFEALETTLQGGAGPYCMGEQITLADVVLAPQVTGTRVLYRLDMSSFPTLLRIHEALGHVEAFAKVRPDADR